MTFDPKLVVWQVGAGSGVLVTKSGWNRSRHDWDISLRSVARRRRRRRRKKKERKKELDMRPLPRARVKLGGWTRSPRFCWKKPFDPCDPKSKFEPISFEEGSTWCICMSYIDKVHNIEEIMHFLVKIKVWPLWPQVDLWPHNIGRGSQANVHVWIVWSCYIQRTSYSFFFVKMTFWPLWPQMTPDEFSHPADAYAWITWPYHVIWRSYSVFGENELLTPVTPNDPGWIFRPITFVQSI